MRERGGGRLRERGGGRVRERGGGRVRERGGGKVRERKSEGEGSESVGRGEREGVREGTA